MSALVVVVLTYNEELNLPDCLASLQGLGQKLVVVDSGSTDRTLAIAAQHGACILTHTFAGHAQQWRWALDQLEPQVEWVLGLDADQRLSPELRAELADLFAAQDRTLLDHDGFYLNRRQIFRGQWIRHGGYYPKYLLKRYDLIEDNHKEANIAFWLTKHIGYAELHAREELVRRGANQPWLIQPALFASPDQRVVWCKQLWYRLPLYARPFLYFTYRYILLGGLLDGKQGFIFHFMQSFWYRLLVDIRLDELRGTS